MHCPSFSFTARHRQRGAATLVVVMLLFFVVSLVAGYASRNLIFEQRTSANQYRSTQSMEAAEAGLEWAQTMLNSGRIDASCVKTTDTTLGTFKQRYLVTNPTDGTVTLNVDLTIRAACTFNGTTWVCACPTTALTATSLPSVGPAFSVRFVDFPGGSRPGLVRAEINGCASYELECITAGSEFVTGSCQSTLCSLLSLHSGAKSPPAAAVTARGTISGSALAVSNQSTTTAGITLHAGGGITAVGTWTSLPGTPPAASVVADDAALLNLSADSGNCLDCTFASVFGLAPETYRQQQGMLEVDCSTVCSAASVNAALASARGRMVWLRNAGGLRISSSTEVIGTATDPVVIVIEGPLLMEAGATAASPNATRIFGLVYAASAQVDGGEIRGALVSAGNVAGDGTGAVAHDAALLQRLKLTSGSYVRVPGAWRDFP